MVMLTHFYDTLESRNWLFLEVWNKREDRADLLRLTDYPQFDGSKGLIVSPGAAAIWLFGKVYGFYRNRAAWLATYDPKQKGFIVTDSTNMDYPVGMFVEANLPCLVCAIEDGKDTRLRLGAVFPYCKEHQDRSPERRGSGVKKLDA